MFITGHGYWVVSNNGRKKEQYWTLRKKKESCNSCPHSDCPHAKNKLGMFLKEEGEDNIHVQGIQLYNQSLLKPFGLGSPNQLFISCLFINKVILTVKIYT